MNRCIIFVLFNLLLLTGSCNKDDRTSTLRENTTSNPDTKNDSSAFQIALDNMMRNLHAHKITGNPDYDFVMLLLPHHQGAVDISNAYLTAAKDNELKTLANNIINQTQSEINGLKNWSNVYKDTLRTLTSDDYRGRLDDNMTEMMKHVEIIRSSDPDMDYVLVMLPHHRDAIEMAKVEIDFGRDENLKNMAKNLIKVNQEHIRIMEEWRAKRE